MTFTVFVSLAILWSSCMIQKICNNTKIVRNTEIVIWKCFHQKLNGKETQPTLPVSYLSYSHNQRSDMYILIDRFQVW